MNYDISYTTTEDFDEMIAEGMEYSRKRRNNVITTWLKSIGYSGIVGYHITTFPNIAYIYTMEPGILIGKGGVNVETLKKMLSDEFYGEWRVLFTEVRDGFVTLGDKEQETPTKKPITFKKIVQQWLIGVLFSIYGGLLCLTGYLAVLDFMILLSCDSTLKLIGYIVAFIFHLSLFIFLPWVYFKQISPAIHPKWR